MATSRGKDFEAFVLRDMLKIPNVDIIRLYDPVGGYSGVRNICDFIVYYEPHMLCLECKSIKGNTLSYNDIRQYTDLVKQTNYKGVRPGVLIWYIDHKEVWWVGAMYMKVQREELHKKSINIKDLRAAQCSEVIKIDASVPRINPVCDFTSFLQKI